MKKAIIVLMLTVFCLTACHKQVQTENTPPSTAVSTPKKEIQPLVFDENEFLEGLGCQKTSGSFWTPYVSQICKAIIDGNENEFSELIGATAADYDFFDSIKTDHYSMYCFYPTQEATALAESNARHVSGDEFYLVKFNVIETTLEEIPLGENAVIMLPCDEAIAKCLFSSIDEAYDFVFAPDSTAAAHDYDFYFIDEFLALYANELHDGLNSASNLDFSQSVHLITHLMAHSGHYRSYPPYSANEINEFLGIAFSGNKGINFSNKHNEEIWLDFSAKEKDTEYKYGCALAHGGSELEYEMLGKTVKDGITTLEIQTFSDRARINKAYKILLSVKFEKDKLPILISAEVIENTGRKAAGANY